MDDITPDQAFGVAVACVVLLLLIALLIFRFACPRSFHVFFGCKMRSAPPRPKSGRRKKVIDPSQPEVLTMNPVLVLKDRKETLKATYDSYPLRVKRHRKEFTVAPIPIRKDGLT